MFGKGYRLFKLLGFEVRVDPTWLILGVLITWTLAQGVFPAYVPGRRTELYWWMGVVGALGLLFSIIFHEFSHSLVARRSGLPIRGITLFIFGGVAEMEDEPATPRDEFLMAVAGPLASLVLAALFYATFMGMGGGGTAQTPASAIVFYLAYLNLILALFNLVPAFPLDGGRMLRAVLWGWWHDMRAATRICARIGSGFGVVLVVLGVLAVLRGNFIGGMWWFLIGMFLRSAAQMSYRQLLLRQALQGEPVQRFMNRSPITVSPDTTVHDLVENYIYRYHYKMFPVVEGSELLGWVSTEQARNLPRAEWDRHTVREILQHSLGENTVAPDTDAMRALALMNRTGRSRLLVVDHGRLIGILALRDLMKFLSLKLDLEDKTT